MIELLGRMGASVTVDERMRVEVDPTHAPARRRRRTSWSRPCAPRSWCSGPLVAEYGHGRRVAARRLRHRRAARSTSTWPGCRPWAPRSTSRTATSAPAPGASRAPASCMDTVTVTGTENLMMAAVPGRGRDHPRERGARARDRRPGAVPDRDGREDHAATAPIPSSIEGVERMHGTHYEVLPDRIEAGTYLVAGAITGGRVRARNARAGAPRRRAGQAGGGRRRRGRAATASSRSTCAAAGPRSVDIRTAPHPGFPTDMQAQFAALEHAWPTASAPSSRRSSRTASCTCWRCAAWAPRSASRATPPSSRACRG